jgi:hypothetical protein
MSFQRMLLEAGVSDMACVHLRFRIGPGARGKTIEAGSSATTFSLFLALWFT